MQGLYPRLVQGLYPPSPQVREARLTEIEIAASREAYRPIAARGSLIFFLIEQLHMIDHMYQFSLDTFNYMYVKVS